MHHHTLMFLGNLYLPTLKWDPLMLHPSKLFDPYAFATSSHHLIHIVLSIFNFLQLFVCFQLYSLQLHHLDLCLLLPRNLEIKIFKDNIFFFEFWHLQKEMLSNKTKQLSIFLVFFFFKKTFVSKMVAKS
jgi:hypothetical protein